MAKKSWAAFPHKDKAFDYAGDKLAKAWSKLHAGDQEPYPDEKHVAGLLKGNPKLGKDAATIAAQLQDAWRDFHRGDFQQAHESGLALKALGTSVAIKAAGIHAGRLVDDPASVTSRYEDLVRLAEEAVIALPGQVNSHFRRAFALACLRNGMDIISLSRLMGHSTVEVLKRYLDQGQDDLRKAHYAAGVVDRLRA